VNGTSHSWPALPFAEWKDTAITLHMWTQIVGKIRLTLSPWMNHSWHVTLYVTSRGLTTSPIPHGSHTFEIQFDFIDHQLLIDKSDGARRTIPLKPQSVAEFYRIVMKTLGDLEVPVTINTTPNEIENPIPFDQDEEHHFYDREYANRFWRVLVQSDRVFKEFRSRFCGKCSPVHFFWGSFDLAVTRFSGRRAPERPGADPITKEAYSHEVISVGFWPGDGEIVKDAAFYAYAAPEPAGFKERRVRPAKAFYSTEKNEFFLMYDDVRSSDSPEKLLLDFCQSTYEAGAILGNWDRPNLERYAAGATNA